MGSHEGMISLLTVKKRLLSEAMSADKQMKWGQEELYPYNKLYL